MNCSHKDENGKSLILFKKDKITMTDPVRIPGICLCCGQTFFVTEAEMKAIESGDE